MGQKEKKKKKKKKIRKQNIYSGPAQHNTS